jgi:transposase-like protein
MTTKAIVYTRSCYHCKQTKQARIWFKSSRPEVYVCHPCHAPYTRDLEGKLSKSLTKLSELLPLKNSLMLKTQEVEELEETVAALQNKIKKLQEY